MAQNQALQSYKEFKPQDYILGRVAVPPWILSKVQRPFIYSGKKTIADGATARLDVQIQDDAYFLIEGIQIIAPGVPPTEMDKASVQITDTTTGRNWSNQAVPLRDIAGIGTNPKWLSDPNILRPSSTLAIQITNNSGASNTFFVALVGRKIYDVKESEAVLLNRRLWSQYVLTIPVLAASAADVVASVQIYNNADFLVKKLSSTQLWGSATLTPGPESGEILFNLKDTTTDKTLFDQKILAKLILGSLQTWIMPGLPAWGQAFSLRKPWLLRRNGKISGYFDNQSTDPTPATIDIVMEGVSIFDAT